MGEFEAVKNAENNLVVLQFFRGFWHIDDMYGRIRDDTVIKYNTLFRWKRPRLMRYGMD